MLNKVKTMKLSDCIEVKKAEYTYIQVIPSKSCRNTNTDKLLVLANTMYQKLDKLYKIEKAESLVGQNYMYPYRKQHVAGVVLNVFPVKFLVYAIDVEKDGFTKETRYYIDVASLN